MSDAKSETLCFCCGKRPRWSGYAGCMECVTAYMDAMDTAPIGVGFMAWAEEMRRRGQCP